MPLSIHSAARGRVRATLTALACAASVLASCQEQTSKQGPRDTRAAASGEPIGNDRLTEKSQAVAGRVLAERWCATCHAFPQPSDLPRERWAYMIKWMSNYLGH